jgi:hypothetical protein
MQETCEKNKANQAKVKFHQTTGWRSYMVHFENLVSHTFVFYTVHIFLVHYYDVTSCILIVFMGRSTMMKITMLWIWSRSATTTRKRKDTHLMYNLLL